MTTTIHIEFLSDWHVGSGSSGPEGADQGIVRDHEGFPYVPAKTLTGILRDSLELVIQSLDHSWRPWLDFVFGSQPNQSNGRGSIAPIPASVSVRPAVLSRSVKALLATSEHRSKLTHVRAGVEIDDETGTARQGHLRFAEVNRPVELSAHLSITQDFGTRETVLALLGAACSVTESIGGKRRKGLGRCRMSIRENNVDLQVDLELSLPISAPPVPTISNPPALGRRNPDDGSPLVPLDCLLTARTPVLVATSVIGNITSSADHIPGSALLPHLHRWLEEIGADAQTLISTGRVCALRAVPSVNNERFLPVSFLLQRPKNSAFGYWGNSLFPDTSGESEMKQARSGWIYGLNEPFVHLPSISRKVITHNSVDDEKQSPGGESGSIYSYEALVAGTTFHSRFLIPSSLRDSLSRRIMAEDSISVGKSKKDDYGWLSIEVLPNFITAGQSSVSHQVRVLAASDTVPSQGPTLEAWTSDLVSASAIDPGSIRINSEMSRIRFTRVDSWHSSWGFPRPTIIAIAAGSSLVLEAKDTETAAALRVLTGGTVGQRRAEGFGEVFVDHPILALESFPVVPVDQRQELHEDPISQPSESEVLYVTAVSHSVIQQRIRQRAISSVMSLRAQDSTSGVRALLMTGQSQLGRLRGWTVSLDEPLTAMAVPQLRHDVRNWPKAARDVVIPMLTDREWIWATIGLESGDRRDPFGNDFSHLVWGDAVRTLLEVLNHEASRANS